MSDSKYPICARSPVDDVDERPEHQRENGMNAAYMSAKEKKEEDDEQAAMSINIPMQVSRQEISSNQATADTTETQQLLLQSKSKNA